MIMNDLCVNTFLDVPCFPIGPCLSAATDKSLTIDSTADGAAGVNPASVEVYEIGICSWINMRITCRERLVDPHGI